MPVIPREQAEVYFETYGESGPWVTLINGHTRTHKDFRMLIKTLVSSGYRCLAMDNRGSGQSTAHAPFTLTQMTSDIEAIWNKLEIKETHLLGISMGGMISQALTKQNPKTIKTLCLISTASSNGWISDIGDEPWGDTISEVLEKLEKYFAHDFIKKNKLLIQSMAKQILKGIEEGAFSDGARMQREAMQDILLEDDAKNITCPTLIIHGLEDQIIDPRAASVLDDKINNSELILVEGVGHLLLAEYSKKLYQHILDFIETPQSN